MKKSNLIVIAAILTLAIVACTKPVYRQTVEQWLSTAPGKASYNVSGQWRGPEGHHYNYWTAENEMKWQHLQGSEGNFSFGGADGIVNAAQQNGIKVKAK